jgi:flagellin
VVNAPSNGDHIVIENNSGGKDHTVNTVTGNAANLLGGALTVNAGTNRSGASMAAAITSALNANATLKAAGLTASFDGTKLAITGTQAFQMNAGAAPAKGTTTGTVDVSQGADFTGSPMTLKVSVDSGAAKTVTLNQNYSTTAALVKGIQDQLTSAGAAATVGTVSINGKQYLQINTNTTGPTGSIQIQSNGTANALLGMTDNSVNSSSNQVDVGFGTTNTTSVGTLGLAKADSSLSVVDAGGTSQTGAISFNALTSGGGQTQALTIAVNDASGTMHSATITLAATGKGTTDLANDGSGDNIDNAVSYINIQLQKSNVASLQSVVAVKESVGGLEQVNFISSTAAFQVGIGSATNGEGFNGGVAESAAGVQTGSGSTVSVLSQSDALAAVDAVSAAITALGAKQAAVGKGQNQLNYAVNLAQSQISNFSAAESRIRDADVAAEAANLTKAQVLQQANMAAMAQANSAPQAVMALLRG